MWWSRLLTWTSSCPQTSSYLDVTPSPSKLLTDHPLGAFIKEEEEEETSCDVTTLKQEVKSEAAQLPLKEEEARDQEEVQGPEVLVDSVQSEDTA